jgi:GntR family transcriptional regulator/MocR family aminotransferase
MQCSIPLSRTGGPLHRQVYAGLRQAILAGVFQSGDRLPSTRELAEQLGISRTVALGAYEQLLAEGLACGRPGSGTYVASGVHPIRRAPSGPSVPLRLAHFGCYAAASWSTVSFPARRTPSLPYDFAYGRSDLESFPLAMWRRILLRCARRSSLSDLDYGAATGDAALQEAICAHLRRSRALNCEPSQIIVVNGSQQALDLISRVLIEPGDGVAIEDPSYQGTLAVLRGAAARVLAIPVDRDGLDPARIPGSARVAFVTPSHQFPTGVTLPLPRRLALLQWAQRRNAVIVEDDYDGEFQYEGQPLASLQGLDRDSRVVYIGTFSRTIFPALRIGYLVSPTSLVPAFVAAKWLCDRHTPSLEQKALAEFISSGLYERYLLRARRRNASRRAVLLDAIGKHLGDRVDVTGDGAGAHVVLWPRAPVMEDRIIAIAAAHGVGVYGISAYCLGKPSRPGILLGYSGLTERQIEAGIRRLARAL